MIFFTSDTHYWHTNVIRYCDRPFSSVEEMNEELIKRYNEYVKPKDEVWHLGDFAFKNPVDILDRLNGRKHLVKGNHDKRQIDVIEKSGLFESIHDYFELKWNHQDFILFHYPIARWNKGHHGSIHLHGHSHQDYKALYGKILDIGVDGHVFRPWSIEEVVEYVKGRPLNPHHGDQER